MLPDTYIVDFLKVIKEKAHQRSCRAVGILSEIRNILLLEMFALCRTVRSLVAHTIVGLRISSDHLPPLTPGGLGWQMPHLVQGLSSSVTSTSSLRRSFRVDASASGTFNPVTKLLAVCSGERRSSQYEFFSYAVFLSTKFTENSDLQRYKLQRPLVDYFCLFTVTNITFTYVHRG